MHHEWVVMLRLCCRLGGHSDGTGGNMAPSCVVTQAAALLTACGSLCVQCMLPLGLLSGLLFVTSTAAAFNAIQLLGLSKATGIWCVLLTSAFCSISDVMYIIIHTCVWQAVL